MAEIVIYGNPRSSYVRTTRMACVEKGVDHDLVACAPGSEVEGASHPFGKIPFARHGDVSLAESGAITRYVDAVFPGPALQPSDAKELARMNMWISAACDYLYGAIIRGVLVPRVVYPMMGKTADEEAVKAAVEAAGRYLPTVDAVLAKDPFLVGQDLTLADLFLFPQVAAASMMPDLKDVMAASPAVRAWHERMSARASASQTMPA